MRNTDPVPTISARPLVLLGTLLLAAGLTACAAPADGPAEDPTTVDPTTEPAPTTDCPAPESGVTDGPSVALTSAELLGADDLPDGVCAYGSDSGDSIWIIAQPYAADFPATVDAWLEPVGWTSEEVGAWGDDEAAESNFAFTPPAGSDIRQAFAHSFEAYPDSVSFNFGIDAEFLAQFGAEGSPLAIFTAYR